MATTTGDWKSLAQQNFDKLYAAGKKFSSDDVWVGLPNPKDPNQAAAMGSIFSTAARNGIITHVGYRKTARPSAKGRDIKVWKPKARKGSKKKVKV